jgi:membrane-associated phospholipid phosphatase
VLQERSRVPSTIRLQAVSAAVWLGLLVGSLILVLMAASFAGLQVSFDLPPTVKVLGVLGVFALLAWRATNVLPRVALVAASFLILWGGGLAGGILCMVAAMFRFPLIDPWLATADTWLGLTTVDVVRWVVAVPFAPQLLHSIYFLSVILLFLTGLALACLGRAERLWEFCAAYGFCLLVATLCSLPIPAAGAFEYLRLEPVFGAQLPPGSGVYWLEALHAVRSSSNLVINPLGLHGLVAFPSFHTSMALMTAAAWRDDRYLRWPMFLWNALVLVSTMPIGGHYVVDVIAGALTWFVIFRFGPQWAGALLRLRTRIAALPKPEAAHARSAI